MEIGPSQLVQTLHPLGRTEPLHNLVDDHALSTWNFCSTSYAFDMDDPCWDHCTVIISNFSTVLFWSILLINDKHLTDSLQRYIIRALSSPMRKDVCCTNSTHASSPWYRFMIGYIHPNISHKKEARDVKQPSNFIPGKGPNDIQCNRGCRW